MRINSIKTNYKTFKGQINNTSANANTTTNNNAQKPPVQKPNPLKQISTSTCVYSAAAIGLLVGGTILHHHLKANPKKLKQIEKENPIEDLKETIKEEITEPKTKEIIKPKAESEEIATEIQNNEILEPKIETEVIPTEPKKETLEPKTEKLDVANPTNIDFVDDTFKKLETNPEELKNSFNSDSSKRKEFFKDFDNALDSKDKKTEDKVFAYLTNPNNSRESQNLIYDHMENDYKPTFDSLVDNLYTSNAGRTYIPALRVMTKRGNKNDIKEIQTIMQTPNVSSMIYTNIAVSYKKLPKERFDKDIIPIFDGLYADKKIALLQVFETHKSKEYVPLINDMSKIEGYESYIYPQIEHAKESCQG